MALVGIPRRKLITFTPPTQLPPESREIRKHMSRARHARHRPASQSLFRANVYLTLDHETWRIFLSRFSAVFGERLLGMKVKSPATLMPRKANSFARTGRSAYHRIRNDSLTPQSPVDRFNWTTNLRDLFKDRSEMILGRVREAIFCHVKMDSRWRIRFFGFRRTRENFIYNILHTAYENRRTKNYIIQV